MLLQRGRVFGVKLLNRVDNKKFHFTYPLECINNFLTNLKRVIDRLQFNNIKLVGQVFDRVELFEYSRNKFLILFQQTNRAQCKQWLNTNGFALKTFFEIKNFSKQFSNLKTKEEIATKRYPLKKLVIASWILYFDCAMPMPV